MAIYYALVFALLAVEMVLFTIVSLPFPRAIRRRVLHVFSIPFKLEQFQIGLKFVLIFVLILFIDLVNRVWQVTAELHSASDPRSNQHTAAIAGIINDRAEIQARRFYSQRNMYLCGFTLFLTLIIIRTYSLVAELTHTKDTLDQLKQAKPTTGVDADEVDEVLTLKAELKQKEEDVAILKDQAKKLSDDYYQVRSEKSGSVKPAELVN